MHKLLLFIIFQLCFVTIALNQSIEELNRLVESSMGQNKVNYQLKLAQKLIDIDDSRSMRILDSVLKTKSINQESFANACYLKARLYLKEKKYDVALENAKRSLSLYQDKNIKNERVSRSLVALIYEEKTDYKNSVSYYKRNYEAYKKHLDYDNSSKMGVKVAHLYNQLSQTQEAVKWYGYALELIKKTDDKYFEASTLLSLSGVYNNYGDYSKSLFSLNKALGIAKENGYSELYDEILLRIEEVDENKNIDVTSVTAYSRELIVGKENEIVELKDVRTKSLEEIASLSKENQIYELTLRVRKEKYERDLFLEKMEKAKVQDSLKQSRVEKRVLQLELDNVRLLNEKKNIENHRLFLAVLLLFCLVVFVLIVLYQKVKSKRVIEKNREEIRRNRDAIEKQRAQLEESIKYAKRIQNAVLPVDVKFLNPALSGFVFNAPKADVSGDFVWCYELDDKLVFCLADSTGHGVPGAFMSIVFSSFLEDIIKQRRIVKPARILQECGKLLTNKVLANGDRISDFKDGMDAVVLAIDYKSFSLEFAGAMNGIYLVNHQEKLYYPGDRASIDISTNSNQYAFKNTKIQLKKGDSIVMTTDGYTDQKGGEKNTKFYRSRFEDLISKLPGMDVEQQRSLIATTFENWKMDREQVDDVMLACITFKE